MRPLIAFIGWRYTRAKRRQHFISFISLISMLGIALGVAALIIVISVMNGFQQEVRARILGMTAHINLTAWDQRLPDWPTAAQRVNQQPHVTGSAPFIRGEVMLANQNYTSASIIRGIDPQLESQISEVDDKMLQGQLAQLQAGDYSIILGKELADNLAVGVGDKVTVITPQASTTPVGMMPRFKRFTVVGIFQIGTYLYDRSLALIHLEDAAKLYRLEGAIHGLQVQTDDLFQAPILANQLRQHYPAYNIQDWTQQHSNYFKAVKIEKTMMFIILTLIIAVAAFNIISTLMMVVTDKQADIAILRTLGLTPLRVMGIFMVQGTLIGSIGTLLGVGCGVTVALNLDTIIPYLEAAIGRQLFPSGVYYIDQVPSDLHWNEVGFIAGIAFALSLLATVYPAWRASQTQPAEALRYE